MKNVYPQLLEFHGIFLTFRGKKVRTVVEILDDGQTEKILKIPPSLANYKFHVTPELQFQLYFVAAPLCYPSFTADF